MFALDFRVDAGVGLQTTTLMDYIINRRNFFTDSSVNSLVSWAFCLLLWRNFERSLGLFFPCWKKNDGFAGLGGTGAETSLAWFFAVILFCFGFWETGVNRWDSLCLRDDSETQLMSSHTRFHDWLNWPLLLRLLSSSSNFSRREINFEWRFMTEFMLLELTFPFMMPSRLVFSSSTPSLILLINRECGSFFSAQRMSVRDQADFSCWAQSFWSCSARILPSGVFFFCHLDEKFAVDS